MESPLVATMSLDDEAASKKLSKSQKKKKAAQKKKVREGRQTKRTFWFQLTTPPFTLGCRQNCSSGLTNTKYPGWRKQVRRGRRLSSKRP